MNNDNNMKSHKVNVKVKSYSGDIMYGKEACNLNLRCPSDEKIHTVEFLIMDTDSPAIFGHEAIEKIKLQTKNINTLQKGLREEFDDLFRGFLRFFFAYLKT